MTSINKIKEITESSNEHAEYLYKRINELPLELCRYVSDHLSIVNAFNADLIEVKRGVAESEAYIIVKRIKKNSPVGKNGKPNYMTVIYYFDNVMNYYYSNIL